MAKKKDDVPQEEVQVLEEQVPETQEAPTESAPAVEAPVTEPSPEEAPEAETADTPVAEELLNVELNIPEATYEAEDSFDESGITEDPLLDSLVDSELEEGLSTDFVDEDDDSDSLADALITSEETEALIDDDFKDVTAPLSGDADDQVAEIEFRTANKAPKTFDTKLAKASQASYVNAVLARDKREAAARERNVITPKMISTWQTVKMDYLEQRTVTKARIIGAKVVGKIPCARVKVYDTFIGYIPFTELWINIPANARPRKDEKYDDFRRRILTLINDMATTDKSVSVPVIITRAQYRDDEFAIIASRRKAMLRDVASFYKPPEDKSNRRHVKQGDVVTATVISVSANRVLLNVRGVDVLVPITQLTCRYQPQYAPGDKVQVRVENIQWPEDDRHIVHLELDYKRQQEILSRKKPGSKAYNDQLKEVKKDRLYRVPKIYVDGRPDEVLSLYKKNGKQLAKNDRCKAIVTNLSFSAKTGLPYVWLWIPEFELPAFSVKSSGDLELGVGSEVDFVVDGVARYELPYFRGRITRSYKKADT